MHPSLEQRWHVSYSKNSRFLRENFPKSASTEMRNEIGVYQRSGGLAQRTTSSARFLTLRNSQRGIANTQMDLRQKGYLLREQEVSAILAQSNSIAAMTRPVALATKCA